MKNPVWNSETFNLKRTVLSGTNPELLLAWTGRIVRARYQQSILGGLWAVIQPAATAAIFSVVFTQFIRVNTGGIPYVVFSFAALVPWTLSSTSLTDMVSSIVDNLNLVTKIYFPREILPMAALLARLLDFGIAFVVLMALMVFFQMPLLHVTWLYLPLILAIQIALTLGLGFAAAGLNVFLRDIKHLVMLGLQIWLYASPVIYPVTAVPEKFRSIYFLNPMAGILEAYRAVLLYDRAPDGTLIVAALVSFVILLLGLAFFKRVELDFADIV